MQSTYVFNESF